MPSRLPFKSALTRMALLAALGLLASCSHDRARATGPPRPALINHVVLCKLHDSAEAGALIAECRARLRGIPGVVAFSVGQHIDSGRSSVDSNYDVGLYIGFNSEQAYAEYVDHPAHVALVTHWQPRMQWLRVYDILDESP